MQGNASRRITAIWSRDVDTSELAGRTKIICAIRSAMSRKYLVHYLRLHSLVERRDLQTILSTVVTALRTLLSGHLPSLQCLLFCNAEDRASIRRELRESPPDTLYCDGVRTFYLLQSLGDLRARMRIVVDMDDLMSRRMESLGSSEISLSLGYLRDKVPAWLNKAIANGFMSRFVARYEQAALSHVEDSIGRWADDVVLVSQLEGEILQQRYQKIGCKARVHIIAPPSEVVSPPLTYATFSHFCFIGTDKLPQNKISIQRILDIWSCVHPAAEVHIFGSMVSNWPAVPGVIFRGYAPSLKDVYQDGAVLFVPGGLRGGLKTKVVEAFAHGCAVAGNQISFEGLHLRDYPLIVETEKEMIEFVISPSASLPQMRRAAVIGQEFIRTNLRQESFEQAWYKALG